MTKDISAAVRTWLTEDVALASLVTDRIYIPRLPDSVIAGSGGTFHPPKMLVLRPDGGTIQPTAGPFRVATIGYDVRAYGESDFDADQVLRACADALLAISRAIRDGVMLHYAEPVTAPVPEIDPETSWPVAAQSWAITAEWREQ